MGNSSELSELPNSAQPLLQSLVELPLEGICVDTYNRIWNRNRNFVKEGSHASMKNKNWVAPVRVLHWRMYNNEFWWVCFHYTRCWFVEISWTTTRRVGKTKNRISVNKILTELASLHKRTSPINRTRNLVFHLRLYEDFFWHIHTTKEAVLVALLLSLDEEAVIVFNSVSTLPITITLTVTIYEFRNLELITGIDQYQVSVPWRWWYVKNEYLSGA